ncbi:MAG: hypothetical protein QOE97_3517 [Pseudonocardiales bacterium]|jgi:hypothetical protein|nr:hypothetical protein [Pseudonocardiales bacterium]
MEFASYLAGERWSDHPACTHPLLASLARGVNDHISDDGRQTLAVLVPEVIGLTSPDLRVDVVIARRAARTALPIAPEERQWVMAVAMLNCERLLADLEGCPGSPISAQSQQALDRTPGAAAWTRHHYQPTRISQRVFRRQTAPAIVGCAVDGIAHACVNDPDRRLHDLLEGAIGDCRTYCSPDRSTIPADSPALAAAAPTGQSSRDDDPHHDRHDHTQTV